MACPDVRTRTAKALLILATVSQKEEEMVPSILKNTVELTSLVCRLVSSVHLCRRASDNKQYVALLFMFRGASFGASRSLVGRKQLLESKFSKGLDCETYGERYS